MSSSKISTIRRRRRSTELRLLVHLNPLAHNLIFLASSVSSTETASTTRRQFFSACCNANCRLTKNYADWCTIFHRSSPNKRLLKLANPSRKRKRLCCCCCRCYELLTTIGSAHTAGSFNTIRCPRPASIIAGEMLVVVDKQHNVSDGTN